MFARVRRRKRALQAPGASPAPCPPGSALEPGAQGACAEGGAQGAGRCSQRLRRAAASLARTDAIIASPRQTPREFRSPHGNCSSRSRSRLHSPFPRGESESESEISVRPRPAPPPTVANGRGPHAGLGGGQWAAECPCAASAPPPARAAGSGLGVRGAGSERARPGGRAHVRLRSLGAAQARARRPCHGLGARTRSPALGHPSLSGQSLARCSRALRIALPPQAAPSPGSSWLSASLAHPPPFCTLFTSGPIVELSLFPTERHVPIPHSLVFFLLFASGLCFSAPGDIVTSRG